MIEEPEPNPEVMEEIFMKCLFSISDKGKDLVRLQDVISCIIEKTGMKENSIPTEKLFTRLRLEGFIEQDSPGLIKMLPCGDLDFENEFESSD
jgi:hypothetical protein